MVPDPPNASDGLVYGVAAQASFEQHRARQDRPRIAILNHQGSQSRVAGVFGGEAIAHCNLRHIMRASGGTRARHIGHAA
eukprot:2572630-Alexandrium_andersonii.AAC.1